MDNLTPEQRRKNMQLIRSRDTIPEKIIAKELRKHKIRFRRYSKKLPGKPDFVLIDYNTIIFVDSDFWHGNPKRFIKPKSNIEYWENKIKNNKERDKKVNRELRKLGWKVIRIWEYDIKQNIEKKIIPVLEKIKSN